MLELPAWMEAENKSKLKVEESNVMNNLGRKRNSFFFLSGETFCKRETFRERK